MFYAIDPEQQRVEAAPKAKALCPACGGDVRAKCGKVVTWHWAHLEKECDPFSEPMTAWHKEWQETVPKDCREVVIGPHRADILSPLGVVVELQHSSISVDEIREREAFYGQMVWVFDARDATQADAIAEAKRTNALREQRQGWLKFEHIDCTACHTKAQEEVDKNSWYALWHAQISQPHVLTLREQGVPPDKVAALLGVDEQQRRVMLQRVFEDLSSNHIAEILRSEGLIYRDPPARLEVSRRPRPDGSVKFWWKHPRKTLSFCERPVFLDLGQDRLLRMDQIDTTPPCDGHGHLMQKSEFVNLINGRRPA